MSDNPSGRLVSIDILAGKFNSYAELQQYTDEQFKIILKLKADISTQKRELEHLQSLLAQTNPIVVSAPSIIKVDITAGQDICEIQIEKLRDKAHNRELTLEETKRLEILIKSLYLIKEKDDSDIEPEYSNLSEKAMRELVALAVDDNVREDK